MKGDEFLGEMGDVTLFHTLQYGDIYVYNKNYLN
jgi:hypothetical protein